MFRRVAPCCVQLVEEVYQDMQRFAKDLQAHFMGEEKHLQSSASLRRAASSLCAVDSSCRGGVVVLTVSSRSEVLVAGDAGVPCPPRLGDHAAVQVAHHPAVHCEQVRFAPSGLRVRVHAVCLLRSHPVPLAVLCGTRVLCRRVFVCSCLVCVCSLPETPMRMRFVRAMIWGNPMFIQFFGKVLYENLTPEVWDPLAAAIPELIPAQVPGYVRVM
jgi:hypothetical protein